MQTAKEGKEMENEECDTANSSLKTSENEIGHSFSTRRCNAEREHLLTVRILSSLLSILHLYFPSVFSKSYLLVVVRPPFFFFFFF